MGIFIPKKSGEAMGTYSYGRLSKGGKIAFAKSAKEKEEHELSINTDLVKKLSEKFREVQRKQLRDLKQRRGL